MKVLKKTCEKALILSFLGACMFPCPQLCYDHVSMVQMIALRSTVDRYFQTPLTVLYLTEGGGGGGGVRNR
jgi:hypothetical protein